MTSLWNSKEFKRSFNQMLCVKIGGQWLQIQVKFLTNTTRILFLRRSGQKTLKFSWCWFVYCLSKLLRAQLHQMRLLLTPSSGCWFSKMFVTSYQSITQNRTKTRIIGYDLFYCFFFLLRHHKYQALLWRSIKTLNHSLSPRVLQKTASDDTVSLWTITK